MTPTTYQLEETLALIAEKANALKGANQPPLFELTLSRRNQSGIPQQLASFTNVTMEHIQDPVRWVPQLCGGGEYIINVRHPDTSGRIGGPIGVNCDKTMPGMEPRALDPRVTRGPNWQGPTLVGGAYTEPPTATAHAGATVPWGAAQLTNGYGLPQAPAAVQAVDREREMAQQLADLRAQNARIEAESRARAELEAERRASDQKVRDERERADRAIRESEQRTQVQIAALQASQPKVDPAAGWTQLVTTFMPLIQQMLTMQQESRMLMLKMNEEANRRQIEASEKQHQAQMEMIRAITAKPAGMSDEMKLLIETLKSKQNEGGDSAIAAMASRLFEGMAVMQKMSIGMIETVADMQMGESEHPAVGAIREFTSAMKIMATGAKEGAQRVIPKKTTQLPPGTRLTPEQMARLSPQQIAQLQQQQRARQAQQQAQQAAAQQAGRQVPPKPPQQPAPAAGLRVVSVAGAQGPLTAVQPPGTPAVPVVTFEPPPAAPQPERMQAPDGSLVTHFELLKLGITDLKPADEVVDYFVKLKNSNELSLQEALDKHGGSPWALIQAEFDMGFLASNQDYFEELGETIDARGVQEGWWPEEPESDEQDGDSDEQEPEQVVVEAAPAVSVVADAPVSIIVPTVPPTQVS